jgi:hypothetical protein
MSGVATAIGVTGLASAYVSSQQGKGGQGGFAQVEQPQYSWNEGLRKTQADYLTGALANLQAGKAPQYWQNAEPGLRAGLYQNASDTYYGTPGSRTGIINNAMAAGTMTGLKGKAAFTPGMQAIKEYGTKRSLIDQYLAQQGVNIMQNEQSNIMGAINSMPSGPGAQVVPWQSQAAPQTDYASIMGNLGSAGINYLSNQPTNNLQGYNYYAGKGLASTNAAYNTPAYTTSSQYAPINGKLTRVVSSPYL